MASLMILFVILACFPRHAEAKIVGTCKETPNFARCPPVPGPLQMESICYREKCILPSAIYSEYVVVAKYQPDEQVDIAKYVPGHQTDDANMKFVVKEMWIRGSGPGLTWDLPIKMNKTDQSTWVATFSYTTDPLAATCTKAEHCSFLQHAVEFRIYLDEHGSKSMLGANFYQRLPLSFSTRYPEVQRITVYPWFFWKQSNLPYTYYSVKATLIKTRPDRPYRRSAGVIYPPSFYENTLKRYRLVICQLGSMLQYHYVREAIAHAMAVEGSLEEVIIATEWYKSELAPYDVPLYRCKDENNCEEGCLNCLDPNRLERCEMHRFKQQLRECTNTVRGGLAADDYILYLEQDLLPRLRKGLKERLLVDFPRNRISIIGYRYSGLFACYAGLARPDMFHNSGCMSAAFYLGIKDYLPLYEFKSYIKEIANLTSNDPYRRAMHKTQKYYIDIGEEDDNYFPLYNARETAEDVVNSLQGDLKLKVSKNVFFQIFPNYSAYEGTYKEGSSNDWPYLQRLLYALLTFHKAEGGAPGHPKSVKVGQSHFVEWEMLFQKHFSDNDVTELEGKSQKLTASANISDGSSDPIEEECTSIEISMPVYLGSLSAAVVVSALTTGLLFCLREANKNADKQKDNIETDDFLDIDTDTDSD